MAVIAARTLGLVLAGGQSRRMGRDKALLVVEGEPLVVRVAARLAAQTGSVAVAAGRDTGRIARLGLVALADPAGPAAGPLAGIAAGLAQARRGGFEALLTAPCDAPACPPDLFNRLAPALEGTGVAAIAGPDGLEPLFALWRVSAEPVVLAGLGQGTFAVHEVMAAAGLAPVAVGLEAMAAFGNLNTPEDCARSGLRFA